MIMWIAMAISAQLVWAGGNYLDKHLLKRYRLSTDHGGPGMIIFISSLTAAVMAMLVGVAAMTLSYFEYEGDTTLSVTPLQALKGFIVGVIQISWMITYLYALEESDETESVPLFQSVPIFALLLGLTVFDEIPSWAAVLGSIIVICGALLLNFNLGTMRLNKRVIALMLLSSFLVALGAFMFKSNAEATNFLSSVFWMKLGIVSTGISFSCFVPSCRHQFTLVITHGEWRDIGLNILNEFFERIARLLFFGAIMMGPAVMSVQATAAYQPLFIFIIGLLLARNGSAFHAERYRGEEFLKKGGAIALIGFGSYLIFK